MSFMRKNKAGRYVADGITVELVFDRSDEYADVLKKSCEAVDVPSKPPNHELVLFTFGGALIPEKEGWNIGSYMRQCHRGPGNTKLGIGFIKVSIACYNRLTLNINTHIMCVAKVCQGWH